MSKLPLVSAKQFEKFLLYLGFQIKRQKGSHVFYRHKDGRYTTLPPPWEKCFIPVTNTSDIKRD